MTADRDVTRIVRSWLEDGVTALPDRVLDRVLDELPATQQHRHSWAVWRDQRMNAALKTALAAVAVVVVALVGINLMSGNGAIVGGPLPSPTATPTPSPSPTPSPTPIAFTSDSTAMGMAPGTYVTGSPFSSRVTFTVPAGWQGNLGGPYAVFLEQPDGRGSISFLVFNRVMADPCHFDKGYLDPQPGPSVDDLATALASMPGVDATTPTDVTVSGYHGKELTLTAPASFEGCTLAPGGGFRTWELPLGATNEMQLGERQHVQILDVGGQRLVIMSQEPANQSSRAKAEVQEVLDSISLAPFS